MTRIIRMNPLRFLSVLLAVGLLATACGGSKSGGGGAGAAGTDGNGAAATPQGVLFFGDANIDPGSDAWTKLQALGSKFPGWADTVTQFKTELNSSSDSGATFEQDIRPWLGSEASVAVVSVTPPTTSGGEMKPLVVAYVESKDDAKLEAAIVKGGKVQKTGDYKGYTLYKSTDGQMLAAIGKNALLVATDDANLRRAIDVREGDAPALADSQTYKDALAKLPKDNLAVGYVDGASIAQLVQLAFAQSQSSDMPAPSAAQLQKALDQLKALQSMAFSVGAEDNGFRFRSVISYDANAAKQAGLDLSGHTFSPSLLDRVPGNALAYVGFSDIGPRLKQALDQMGTQSPATQQQIQSFETQTGLSLQNDILPLLGGEDGFYVAPGGLPVNVGMLLHPSNPDQAVTTIKKITALVSRFSPDTRITPVAGGVGEQATVQGMTVQWRRDGDVIGIGNSPTVGSAQTTKLSDAADYTQLRDQAGLPDKVAELIYVNIPGAMNLAGSFGQSSSDPKVQQNAQHVGGLLIWATSDEDSVTADAFLQVK
jgi:hypothetical protein